MIRWGVWNDSLGLLTGYQLFPDGTVQRYRRAYTATSDETLDTLPVRINADTHCRIADALRSAFIHNQAYTVIGPISHYVEYNTPTAALRATWDARYETYGSRHFRAIFRWLNHSIGNDENSYR
ncbi:MAG: hypothetical protein N2663_05210 [Chlorobi bacterium]|nr:hypothetical protein [Chlorobiota bacterium]